MAEDDVLYEDLDGYTEMAPLQMEDSGEYVIDSIVTTSPDQNHEYTEMVPTIEDSTEYFHVTGPSQDGNGGSGGRALANNTHTTQTSGYSNASESKGIQEESNVNVQSVSTTPNCAYSVNSNSAGQLTHYISPETLATTQMAQYPAAQEVYSEIPSQMPPPPPYWQAGHQGTNVPVFTQPQFQGQPSVVHITQPQQPVQQPGLLDEYVMCACILALVALICSVICTGLLGLIFSIPAIIFAQNASTWKANGDMTKARRYKRCSIGCSIASFAFVAFLLLAVASAWIGVFCGLLQIC